MKQAILQFILWRMEIYGNKSDVRESYVTELSKKSYITLFRNIFSTILAMSTRNYETRKNRAHPTLQSLGSFQCLHWTWGTLRSIQLQEYKGCRSSTSSLSKVSTMLKSEHGKTLILNGWRGAGIAEAVTDARRNEIAHLVDPFAFVSIANLHSM